jgi:ankyrin repeat protein
MGDKDGQTPLHYVMISNMDEDTNEINIEKMKINAKSLLKYGANPLIRDRTGKSPLDLAIQYELIDILFLFIHFSMNDDLVVQFLNHFPSIITKVDQKGRTLLLFSLIYDNLPLFTILFDFIMNLPQAQRSHLINHPDEDGITPLHVAVDHHHVDAVNKLIQSGANVNQITNQGMTPIQFAQANHDEEILNLLLQLGVQQVNEEKAEELRQMGIDNLTTFRKQKQLIDEFPVLSEDQYTAYPLTESDESKKWKWKCPICQMEDTENRVWAWPCCHAYHIDCLKNWGVKCALCNTQIKGITLKKCNKEYDFGRKTKKSKKRGKTKKSGKSKKVKKSRKKGKKGKSKKL